MDATASSTRRPVSRGAAPAAEPAPVRQQQLLEAFSAYCQACLFKEVGAAAREFLIGYGFPADRLEATPIGVFSSAEEVREHLRAMGFAPGELRWFGQAMNELSPGWLVGPVHDPAGQLVTFYACEMAPDGKGAAQYLFLRTGADVPAIGLDVALTADVGGADDLVLVENLLDVLLLHALGVKNVAGICDASRQFSARRWDALGKLGVRKATLAFNPIEPPYAFIQASVDEALRSRHAPTIWLVEPGEFSGASDASDWLRMHGAANWPGFMARRIHALRWKARNLVVANWGAEGLDEVRAAALLADAEAFDRSLRREAVRADLEHHFWPVIRAALQPPVVETPPVEKRLAAVAPMPAPKPLPKPPRRETPPPPKVDPAPVAAPPAPSIERRRAPKVQRPKTSEFVPSVADDLETHERWLRSQRGRSSLGLCQLTMPGLDRATMGLRGLSVLAGRPRCGKSALALQWTWDAICTDPRACALFVSLKAPRLEVMTRLAARLSGLPWNVLVRGSMPDAGGPIHGPGHHFSDEERTRIRKAESLMAGRGKRLAVLDEAAPRGVGCDAIREAVESLRSRTESRRALVVIDCAELWEVSIGSSDALRRQKCSDAARWRLVRRLRDSLEPDDVVLAVSEQAAFNDAATSDVGSFGAAAYLADLLFWLKESDARGWMRDREYAARTLVTIGGRDGQATSSFSLGYRPALGDFVEVDPAGDVRPAYREPIAPPVVNEIPPSNSAHPERDVTVARRGRFTWGAYGADSE